MIHLPAHHLDKVSQILAEHVPEHEVWVFGSRVSGKFKPHSDLDLAIITKTPLESQRLRRLREAFEDSNLPIRVDLVELSGISDEFRKVILEKYEVLKPTRS